MAEQNYLKFKTFRWIVGIAVVILLAVFTSVFAGIDTVEETCNTHIQSHSIISEQMGKLEAYMERVMIGQEKNSDKIDKIFEKINK